MLIDILININYFIMYKHFDNEESLNTRKLLKLMLYNKKANTRHLLCNKKSIFIHVSLYIESYN